MKVLPDTASARGLSPGDWVEVASRRALVEKGRLLKENKVLRGLLLICSGCRRIRDDYERWWPLEAYVKEHSETDFTHTICPDCRRVIYPDLRS